MKTFFSCLCLENFHSISLWSHEVCMQWLSGQKYTDSGDTKDQVRQVLSVFVLFTVYTVLPWFVAAGYQSNLVCNYNGIICFSHVFTLLPEGVVLGLWNLNAVLINFEGSCFKVMLPTCMLKIAVNAMCV